MNSTDQMRLFVEPSSVAIIGSTTPNKVGSFDLPGTLLSTGFSGRVYPVNPKAEQVSGLKAYPTVKAVPEDIDLAVIATPRDTAPPLVRDCVEKGIKAILVVAQGFADADEEGKALQAEIAEIAREGGARIMGPNTFGVANASLGFSLIPLPPQTERNPIGIISQSGLFFFGLPRLNFGKVIDVGNACDIDLADALAYFEDDPDTRLIVLHIEGTRKGREFLQVAKRVARRKPVIVLKGGRSETGGSAVQSHTGSLVGRDEVYEAAFGQCGMIRAADIEELEDLSLAFLRLPPMKGRRLAVASWNGGTMVFAADACERYGLELAGLSPATVSKIGQLAPPWLPIQNPVDLWASIGLVFDPRSFRERIRNVVEALLAEENADAILAITPDFVDMFGEHVDVSSVFSDALDSFRHRPLVFSITGVPGGMAAGLERNSGTVVFPSPERAVRALARLWDHAERLKEA